MSFYINKIIVTGNNGVSSSIDFSNGLNIIYGPSNTGKTMVFNCINYVLGNEDKPFDISTGYDCIELSFIEQNKNITLKRKIDSDMVSVSSNYETIVSGDYSLKNQENYEETLNSIILKIFGIDEQHKLIKNARFEKQKLTWQSFDHMFFIDEDKIIKKSSPLLSEQYIHKTMNLSILLFLLYGKDYSESSTYEKLEITKAKENAIKKYLMDEMQNFSNRIDELKKDIDLVNYDDVDIKVANLLNSIKEIENKITTLTDENKEKTKRILLLYDELVRNNDLIEKYTMLETQYNSDLKRLNFIINGTVNYENTTDTTCPFCDGHIEISDKPDYIDASIANYKKIVKQLNDLLSARKTLEEDITIRKKEITELENVIEENKSFINSNYSLEIVALSNELNEYKSLIAKKQELDFLQSLCNNKTEYLEKQGKIKETKERFSPFDFLDEFEVKFREKVSENLKRANFSLNSLLFDDKDFDFIINGKRKSENGKGYRAFFNSIISLSFVQIINESGYYKPNILILDSPILSLKLTEKDEHLVTSVKNGLFSLFLDNSSEMQTIIFENQIPEIDYKDAKLFHFTLDNKNGRYGFLEGLRN